MRTIVATLAVVLILAASAWLTFAAPCWVYSGTPVKDVPARCVLR